MHESGPAPPPPGEPPRGGLPPRAAGFAAGGFVVALVSGSVLGGVGFALSGSARSPLTLALGFAGFWAPLLGAALLASRATGSGSPVRDLGLRVRPIDVALGPAVAAAGLLAVIVVDLALSPFPDLRGTNTGIVEEQAGSGLGAVVIAIATLVGAPVVEEVFFRGLVQRALAHLGAVAVAAQALVFAFAHVQPDLGTGNVGVVAGITAFGIVQGMAVRRFRRLGPAIVAHVVFNATAVLPILLVAWPR